jgi:hypothetical protein
MIGSPWVERHLGTGNDALAILTAALPSDRSNAADHCATSPLGLGVMHLPGHSGRLKGEGQSGEYNAPDTEVLSVSAVEASGCRGCTHLPRRV